MWLASPKSFLISGFDNHVLISDNTLHHSQWVECHQFVKLRMTLIYLNFFCTHKIHQYFDQIKQFWLLDQIWCSMIQILASIHKWTYTTCIPYALVLYNEFVWVHQIDVFLKISIKNGGLDNHFSYLSLRCTTMDKSILIDSTRLLAKWFPHSWTISI
jgi:hypothetical protein